MDALGTASNGLLMGVILTALASGGFAQAQPRFQQDRFAIGFWVDPPADEEMERHYREVAEANFTLVLAGFGARTLEDTRRALDLCERYGLRAIVWPGEDLEAAPDGPACWGYLVRDEPSASDFPALRERVDAIRRAKPGKLAYINLFPSYASPQQLGTPTYDEHVRRFVDEVGPDVLSMDHYPLMRPDQDTRDAYVADLAVMRRYSLEAGIPFWNFFNTMPFGPHFDPTEAQLRWQIFSSLAYGAKGVLYFCYWTPPGDEFPKGGAIITLEGRKTRHYAQAQRINAEIKALGPTLMRLQSVDVRRVPPEVDPAQALAGTPIVNLSPGDYLVGVFQHEDGRRAVLLNNYSYAFTAWPTVQFDVPSELVSEVSKTTGDLEPVLDDSPAMDGLQISLDSGEGRLFVLP